MTLTKEEKKEMKEFIHECVDCSVSQSIERELGQYKVPKETHYQDHLFLKALQNKIDNIGNTFVKAFVTIIVAGITTAFLYGIVTWVRLKIKLLGG